MMYSSVRRRREEGGAARRPSGFVLFVGGHGAWDGIAYETSPGRSVEKHFELVRVCRFRSVLDRAFDVSSAFFSDGCIAQLLGCAWRCLLALIYADARASFLYHLFLTGDGYDGGTSHSNFPTTKTMALSFSILIIHHDTLHAYNYTMQQRVDHFSYLLFITTCV